MTLDATAARDCVQTDHGDVLAVVDACADAVADSWDENWTGDASTLGDRLAACLTDRGTLDCLPGVLADAVRAAGGELQASPVAAPPYVVVTSCGLVLRGTLTDGRLVVELVVFRVTDDATYERVPDGIDVRVSVR